VAELYQRAAQLAVAVETSTNGIQRKIGPDDAAQQLGDRAGMRFAEAARPSLRGIFFCTRAGSWRRRPPPNWLR
jgi:hypothetical protein